MNFKKLFTCLVLSILIFSSCDVGKGISGAYNMTQCKYEYQSISALSLSGMNLSNGVSLAYIPKITSILSGNQKSIPLDFTLNLDVENPNKSAALLNSLQYIITIDDVKFTNGAIVYPMNIPSGGKQTLPLKIGVDLATLMKNESKTAVENITKNFIGIGNQKSNVKVQIKPSFDIGGSIIQSPVYIPVSFSFGGK